MQVYEQLKCVSCVFRLQSVHLTPFEHVCM